MENQTINQKLEKWARFLLEIYKKRKDKAENHKNDTQ